MSKPDTALVCKDVEFIGYETIVHARTTHVGEIKGAALLGEKDAGALVDFPDEPLADAEKRRVSSGHEFHVVGPEAGKLAELGLPGDVGEIVEKCVPEFVGAVDCPENTLRLRRERRGVVAALALVDRFVEEFPDEDIDSASQDGCGALFQIGLVVAETFW